MIIDGYLQFDSNLGLTSTATSTNVIDLVNARDLGVGDDPAMKLAVIVTETFLSAGATTLQIQVQGSTDNSSYTVMAESAAIGKASLVQGANVFPIHLPSIAPGQALPRYLRLNYVVATGPFTDGQLSAMLVLDNQRERAYPPGITIAN